MTDTDNRLAAIIAGSDNGTATIAPRDVAVSLAAMLAASGRLAVDVKAAHDAEEMTAKEWGCNYLNLVKVHGHDGDTLAQQSREAMGWKDLTGPVGSKIKTRFNTLRSKAGILSGRWNDLTDDQRTALLGGIQSVNTVKAALDKADAEAKRKAAAEKAAAEKAAETAGDKPADAEPAAPVSFADAIVALRAAMDAASDDDLAAGYDAFADMIAAFDGRIAAFDGRIAAAVDAQKAAA